MEQVLQALTVKQMEAHQQRLAQLAVEVAEDFLDLELLVQVVFQVLRKAMVA